MTLIGPHRCARFGPDSWALLDGHGAVVGWFCELADVEVAIRGRA
jgi:hypothetical protein